MRHCSRTGAPHDQRIGRKPGIILIGTVTGHPEFSDGALVATGHLLASGDAHDRNNTSMPPRRNSIVPAFVSRSTGQRILLTCRRGWCFTESGMAI